uniref:AlNc14C87G5554 protein n=1 Tax=Albugo laibachii Nc14 TaxID=890382 RepID=F0WG22_9STRA|nr:AlNc14C87G5554 [Albugo laibachii Nc14]|eukprot:CCA20156.1 AlNc14C87G5554 [Albugo laibachii Nc14]
MMSAEKSGGKEDKKPRLTDHERGKIEWLREADLNLRAIKTITSRSPDMIGRVVCPASPSQPKRRGPAPLLSKRQVRLIVRTAAQGNLSTAQLKAELCLPVSVRCVQRILAKVYWLVYSTMENTLPLTAANMVARKAWAKGMLPRTADG